MSAGDERREPRDELDSALRERVARLDEPVPWDDWSDVLTRSRAARAGLRKRRWGTAVVAAVVIAVAASAAMLARPSLVGLGHGSTPTTAKSLSEFKLAAPGVLPPDAIGWQARVITSVRLPDGRHTLYVAPTTEGAYCYVWTGDGDGGCAQLGNGPLVANWGRTRAVGVVSSSLVSSVKITFTDGTSIEPPLAWVSAPINAGFFLYDIPPGKIISNIAGNDGARTLSQVTWYSV